MTRKVDWDTITDLGTTPDAEIASRIGVSQSRVGAVRRARGVGVGWTDPQKLTIDWDAVPLGKFVDRQLAQELGVSEGSVFLARKSRGILPANMKYRTLCGKAANYCEAVIDTIHHQKKYPHTFQHRIGPYTVDWLLPGNVVWEYAGWKEHTRFGQKYTEKLEKKTKYLESLGYIVIVFEPDEISIFEDKVNLSLLKTTGRCVDCQNCRVQTEKIVRGHCLRCYAQIRKGRVPSIVPRKRVDGRSMIPSDDGVPRFPIAEAPRDYE